MSSYFYSSFVKAPCLPYITHNLNENPQIAGGEQPGMLWETATRVLKVTFTEDLDITEKAMLDGIVNDSDGMVQIVKPRTQIMSEIFWKADRTTPDGNGLVQIQRLMSAVDGLASFLVCLDNYNYEYAKMRMQIPLGEGKITQDDYDLVASCIPDAEFVPGD